MNTIRPACSNKPRARTQRGAKGHAGWDREVYHALKSGMATYCGIDASEFLRMDEIHFNLCNRGASDVQRRHSNKRRMAHGNR